jgi:hypothetical protein
MQENIKIFKRPQLVNFEYYTEEDKFKDVSLRDQEASHFDNINLHVFPCMMAPGKNYYAIKVPESNKAFRLDSELASVAEQEDQK